MVLAEGKARHGAKNHDETNLRAAPRQLSWRALHFLPSGRQDLHFPLVEATVSCVYRHNWNGTLRNVWHRLQTTLPFR
jgi:hypothetical protein